VPQDTTVNPVRHKTGTAYLTSFYQIRLSAELRVMGADYGKGSPQAMRAVADKSRRSVERRRRQSKILIVGGLDKADEGFPSHDGLRVGIDLSTDESEHVQSVGCNHLRQQYYVW
jgi:hypothetical protein